MTNSQRLATVRRCLTRWLAQAGAGAATADPTKTSDQGESTDQGETTGNDEAAIKFAGHAEPERQSRRPFGESILIRDGFFCGRRFDAGSFEAVWFLEEDELKISDSLGQVVCVLVGAEIGEFADEPLPQVEAVSATGSAAIPAPTLFSPAGDPNAREAAAASNPVTKAMPNRRAA